MSHLKVLVPYLMKHNEEFAVETARALGNFSRNIQVRQMMSDSKGNECAMFIDNATVDQELVLLLDHSNRELVYNVCGVLMNFMSDTTSKHILMQVSDGMNK